MLKTRYIKYILALLLLSLDISCFESKIISDKEKFASIYIELQISFEKNRGNLSKLVAEREQVFKKYNVTEKQYNATLDYYGQDKEKWEEFFNLVSARLNKMRSRV